MLPKAQVRGRYTTEHGWSHSVIELRRSDVDGGWRDFAPALAAALSVTEHPCPLWAPRLRVCGRNGTGGMR
jgi:hypothetical protein